ncbi:MAG: alpha/beta hydrolase family protein [Candidatus Eiseniibacteriota bacterium]
MRTRLLALMALSGLLLAAPLAAGAEAPRIDGIWRGSLEGALRLVVHIERTPAGALRGTMDSPDQGAMGLPIDAVAFANDSLRFTMRQIGGEYVARLAAGGDSLDGVWRQSGMALPLVLLRGGVVAPPRRPQVPNRPFPYDTAAVTFDNPEAAGVRLAGTLTVPRGKGPFPCALLVTGSGPEDRDEAVFGHRPFLVLADHLTRNGIAVLRVDDRGVGGSTGRFAEATSEDFASDVLASVEFLKGRKEIDRRRIGLIGHSEGGLIAPMVATRRKDVAFIVLMAGPGIPGDSTLMLQSAAIRRSIGIAEESIAAEMAASRRTYACLNAGDSLGALREARELVRLQIASLPESQRAAVGDLDSAGAAAIRPLFTPWMRFFIRYDPRPTLPRVTCPVLAINGSKDLQVLAKENLAGIESALKAGGHRHYSVKELPGLNHLFQTCTLCTIAEYLQLEETMAPVALDEMTRWIQARATAGR